MASLVLTMVEEVVARAMPKSATLMCPSSVMRMLSGLMSRWTMPLEWAWSRAMAICRAIWTISWVER